MGSLVLRPAGSPPPHPWGWRLDPMYLNAPVARTRPIGRYTLNRKLAWKTPFILQDREPFARHTCDPAICRKYMALMSRRDI